MSRRTGRPSGESFGRRLAWTLLFALIFSAGLITGQRLLHHGEEPLLSTEGFATGAISLSSARRGAEPRAPDARGDEASDADAKRPEAQRFSFYDMLGGPSKDAVRAGEARPSTASEGSGGDGAKEPTETAARYTLQAGAHGSRRAARRQMQKLRSMGLEPDIVAVQTEEGALYRVRVGRFDTVAEARHFKARLSERREIDTMLSPL
jgi:cell division septation protein DedD